MDAAAHIVVAPGPQISGYHHIGAHGEAHKQIDQQVNQGRIGPYCRQGFLAGEFTHHHYVGGVEQQLQQTGGHQRQSKEKDLIRYGPVAHIDLISPLDAPLFQHRPLPSKFLKFLTQPIPWNTNPRMTTKIVKGT